MAVTRGTPDPGSADVADGRLGLLDRGLRRLVGLLEALAYRVYDLLHARSSTQLSPEISVRWLAVTGTVVARDSTHANCPDRASRSG